VGLTGEARAWLEENCTKVGAVPCPHCGKPTIDILKKTCYAKSQDGMFDDGPDLMEYQIRSDWIGNALILPPLKSARVRTVVQATPWSGGPMIYMCLELDTVTGPSHFCKWPDEELERH
jgi:hypothetical protein